MKHEANLNEGSHGCVGTSSRDPVEIPLRVRDKPARNHAQRAKRHTYKGTFSERLAADEAAQDRVRGRTLAAHIQWRIGTRPVTSALLLIIAFQIAYAVGRASALTQEEFLVTNSSPERAVLRIYGDNVIVAPFDRATKTVERAFLILKTGGSGLVLRLEHVGPLHR